MKIVCWGDYAIPVSSKAQWIAKDKSGIWFWYERSPKLDGDAWRPSAYGDWGVMNRYADAPEKGGYKEQIYWLEDM